MPAGIPDAEKTRLTGAAKTAISTVAIPAFQRFDKFLREVYLPASRDTVGIYDIPGGDQYYRNRIALYTTIDNPDPARIHNIGLDEVKRIRGEMEKTLEGINFLGTVDQFLQFLRNDPRFFFKTPEELLAAYTKTANGIKPELPKLFGRLPKTDFEIKVIPAATAPTTTTAYYMPPTLDGSRKGAFYVNLYKPESRPTWEVEALTAHESVPGHHLQVALQFELTNLPNFRRNADYTGFIEGWALYSEKLGYDLGLYKDDFSKFGQLNYDMWRAVRLVVDTGMHAFHWTRDQAVYYFKQNTGRSDLDIQNEVDRYISWPGQALSYKLGQLKIQALRAEAEKALGDRFDIRAFHDKLLGMGALPLSVLEVEMRAWIAEQSARR
jgi:prolyl oligopeptidase